MTTSSDTPQPRKSRFWRWLLLILLIGGGLYSAGWYYAANEVDKRLDATLKRLADRGVTADCVDRAVSGFPLALRVICGEVDYEDEQRQIFFNVDGLNAGVSIWNPLQAEAHLTAPLTLDSPDVPPMAIDWQALTIAARLAQQSLPESITLTARDLAGQTDPQDETQPVPVFEAVGMTAVLQPKGSDLGWTGSFSGLKIDPQIANGRTIPPLAGEGDATIANGAALLRDRPRSLRGQSIVINNLTLSAGDGSLTVSGPISVDQQGLIDASLKVGIKNPQAIGRALQTAMPERAGEINTAMMGMTFLGKEPSVPLKIVKGRATLMGFKLTEIPALQ